MDTCFYGVVYTTRAAIPVMRRQKSGYIFQVEMLYATIAHVSNDWLAVSVSVWVFAAWAAFLQNPHLRTALTASAWLATGLVTKAYFLAFALWAIAVLGATLWPVECFDTVIDCTVEADWDHSSAAAADTAVDWDRRSAVGIAADWDRSSVAVLDIAADWNCSSVAEADIAVGRNSSWD
jgi:hypothetical protein